MALSSKYRSYGIKRQNNLSDIGNKETALNNLLNNLPDVLDGESFISQDLDAIRGLSSTNIFPANFVQLASSVPTYTYVDNDQIRQDIIEPIIRIKDRIRGYRSVTGTPGVLGSGMGPRAYFVPSSNIEVFDESSTIDIDVDIDGVETSDDYWVLGETQINDRIKADFPDLFGGVLWEGYFFPNPITNFQDFNFNTNGLYHVEYDRFSDGNWEVAKSIYADERDVTVAANASSSTTIELQESDMIYVAIGDSIDGDSANLIESISGNTITITTPITVSQNDTITLGFTLGSTIVNGSFQIRTVLDKGETPAIKLRIFWWYPAGVSTPQTKYVLTSYQSSRVLPFYRFSIDPPNPTPSDNEILTLLDYALTPTQEVMGDTGNSGNDYRDFRNKNVYSSLYTPKSSLAEVTKVASIDIDFSVGNKFIEGASATLAQTELGNYIVPTSPADLGSVIPKNFRIKDFVATSVSSTRIVNQENISDQSSYPVSIIDHNGLVDYFVGSSSTNVVTVNDTSKLKVDMLCITGSTSSSDFVRIIEIISGTQFRTSANLSISSAYVFVYANAGVIDRSKEVFCTGVVGQTLSSNASSNILTLNSVDGIELGQIVQFGDSIPSNTTVEDITGNDVEISENVVGTIISGSTIVFAPSGTSVNKESCILPIDLSPPFIGVDRGLETNGKNVKSSFPTEFNVKVSKLEAENTTVNVAGATPLYDSVVIFSNGYKILADKV